MKPPFVLRPERRRGALALLLGAGLLASVARAAFPPLNSPASADHHPGKFVWADLFTTDADAASKFYTGVFGWTAKAATEDGRTYTVFSNGSHPVAGIVTRPASKAQRPSRWIAYVAVDDLKLSLQRVTQAGGQVRADARDLPDRGTQAIVADNEDSTIGLLQSSSGDGADDEPDVGDWNWFELYVKAPKKATEFYKQVFNYDSAPDLRTERKNDYLVSSGGVDRAGIAPLPDAPEAKAGWLGVVRVANLDEALKKATSLGGEVLVQPREAAYESRFAIVADPTGGAIGLVEYVDNANPAQAPNTPNPKKS